MLPIQCHKSVLNRNNPENYKPLVTSWEVEAKSGCCWVYMGVFDSIEDIKAVQHFRKEYKYKLWRVRCSDRFMNDSWHKYKFDT
jgi:hypothetical protein